MKQMLTLCLMLLFTNVVWAGPIEINSEKLAVEHEKNRAEFIGSVHVHQDDFDLYCDRLVTFYKERMGGELQRAEAYGHVRMNKGDQRSSSDKAIYEKATGLLTLIGHAEVKEPGSMLRGEKIEHNLTTTQTRVIKGLDGERVRLIIESDDDLTDSQPSKSNVIDAVVEGAVQP